ncbi:hypothetical protein PP641_gp050 [Arthrobacter phage SilentRX]|uniref:Uncharacterized protein n=1 Tax=Arthrobacter phage SilentRX TaxID=2836091 RepID=A0A8F3INL4_9CAUD|nr:hypothetical protein PP641_gp050 [Arthrobacter phage SilentRX]QWY82790.1 hypothetical protein SEA_SILENTRX_50 [Arthrobacter phage SilentRX]
MSNYPDGVTDAHPHFNPSERPVTVSCTSDEALVIPSFLVKGELQRILDLTGHAANMAEVEEQLRLLLAEVSDNELEGTYECQWEGEVELPVSEEAEFDCPRCGVTQTTDTLPDERDPDDDYDRMRDERYDD